MVQCSLCKNQFDDEAVIKAGEYRVCADCKPLFLQRLREGVNLAGEMNYGGFWIRFVASFVDSLIVVAGGYVLGLLVRLVFGPTSDLIGKPFGIALILLSLLIYWALPIAYATYLVGRFGATLGQMVFGLKVVRSTGEKLSYGRAFGRFLARGVSGIILGIGYIMAGFDSQKRALHDRICDTRVIRT